MHRCTDAHTHRGVQSVQRVQFVQFVRHIYIISNG